MNIWNALAAGLLAALLSLGAVPATAQEDPGITTGDDDPDMPPGDEPAQDKPGSSDSWDPGSEAEIDDTDGTGGGQSETTGPTTPDVGDNPDAPVVDTPSDDDDDSTVTPPPNRQSQRPGKNVFLRNLFKR